MNLISAITLNSNAETYSFSSVPEYLQFVYENPPQQPNNFRLSIAHNDEFYHMDTNDQRIYAGDDKSTNWHMGLTGGISQQEAISGLMLDTRHEPNKDGWKVLCCLATYHCSRLSWWFKYGSDAERMLQQTPKDIKNSIVKLLANSGSAEIQFQILGMPDPIRMLAYDDKHPRYIAHQVGCYGHKEIRANGLEKLAREVLEYAASWANGTLPGIILSLDTNIKTPEIINLEVSTSPFTKMTLHGPKSQVKKAATNIGCVSFRLTKMDINYSVTQSVDSDSTISICTDDSSLLFVPLDAKDDELESILSRSISFSSGHPRKAVKKIIELWKLINGIPQDGN